MRGKKSDSEFVSSFITECVLLGKNESEQIIQEAKNRISDIDSKIIEIEKLKITRSKLIDVISVFDKSKSSNKEEIKILSLFKIENHHICKYICDQIKSGNSSYDKIVKSKYNNQDVLFSVKQLIENKIIVRDNNNLISAERYKEYLNFVLLEKNESSN